MDGVVYLLFDILNFISENPDSSKIKVGILVDKISIPM